MYMQKTCKCKCSVTVPINLYMTTAHVAYYIKPFKVLYTMSKQD